MTEERLPWQITRDAKIAARVAARAEAKAAKESGGVGTQSLPDTEEFRALREAGMVLVDPTALSIVARIDQKWQIEPKDPLLWIRKRLPGRHIWSKQEEVVISVRDNSRTAVKACHGVGKSYIAATIAAWWASAYSDDEALVVSTAPTGAQVSAILWEEIRRAHTEGGLPGKVGGDNQWKSDAGVLVGLGRKPADHAEHAFQGLHKRRVLVLIDEACGIPLQLWTAFEAVATGIHCRQLAIGNPDDPGSEFAVVCKPGSGWNVIKISAFDSPNLTGEEVPPILNEVLVSEEWVADKATRWGVTSPRYQSKVLGEFPEIGDDTLVVPSWIEKAQNAYREGDDLGVSGRPRMAVDVARYGSDDTIIGMTQEGVFEVLATMPMSATTEVVGKVLGVLQDLGGGIDVVVDGAGVGGGVVDGLRAWLTEEWEPSWGRKFKVIDFQASAKPRAVKKFLNLRAEWWWNLREAFERNEVAIDPDDDGLAAQLGAIKFFYNSKGLIQIESKADMKKRGVSSPDRADCMMMAGYGSGGFTTGPLDVRRLAASMGSEGR